MSSSESQEGNRGHLNQRRHPRAYFWNPSSPIQRILGVKATLSARPLEVYDLSFSGMACAVPQDLPLQPLDKVAIELEMPGDKRLPVLGRVVWMNSRAFGVEFDSLSLEHRLLLDDFLQDRLVGGYLQEIDAAYFFEEAQFNVWFAGPKDTHLFFWFDKKKNRIDRFTMELDSNLITYERDRFSGAGRLTKRLRTTPDEELFELLDQEAPLVKRCLEVLSQLSTEKYPIRELVAAILGRSAR